MGKFKTIKEKVSFILISISLGIVISISGCEKQAVNSEDNSNQAEEIEEEAIKIDYSVEGITNLVNKVSKENEYITIEEEIWSFVIAANLDYIEDEDYIKLLENNNLTTEILSSNFEKFKRKLKSEKKDGKLAENKEDEGDYLLSLQEAFIDEKYKAIAGEFIEYSIYGKEKALTQQSDQLIRSEAKEPDNYSAKVLYNILFLETGGGDNPYTQKIYSELPALEIVLLNENGELYVPQHVTIDDFYDKIKEAEEEYKFESDWERDRFIFFALVRNSTFMDEEDIYTVFQDYLVNFGCNTYFNHIGMEQQDIRENKNNIPYSAYFIDPVLAEEAYAFEKYIDTKGSYETGEYLMNKIKAIDNEKCFDNNPLIYEETVDICYCFEASDYIPSSCKKANSKYYFFEIIDKMNLVDISNEPTYKISEYESSHQD